MSTVVVIGAGAVGCATALHLKSAEPGLDVIVVEPDFTYAKAATGKTAGGVRQPFTRPENILMSQYTLEAIEDWQNWETVGGTPPPELNWRANGNLFIVGVADVDTLASNFATHIECGADAEWLEQPELAARYPGLVSGDLAAGVLSRRDGWLNPKVFFSVLKAKAEAAGATFLTDRVIGFDHTGTVVRSVALASGRTVAADAIVNAAGVHTPELATQLGVSIPVEPMRQHEHYVETEHDSNHPPSVKDVDGLMLPIQAPCCRTW